MNYNLWMLLHDETPPLCVSTYLKRAREFFCRPFEWGKPTIMGHIKWPMAATLISPEKVTTVLCNRNGLSFADVPDWPKQDCRKGLAALVLWTEEEITGVTHIILSKFDSNANLLHKNLVKVDDVKVAGKGEGEQTWFLQAEEIYQKVSTYWQQWTTTSTN